MRCDYHKAKMVNDEIFQLGQTYSLDRSVLLRYSKFYLNTPDFKVGNIKNNLAFICYILNCYGYDEEEKTKFINASKDIALADYNDLVRKVVVLSHYGLLDESIFKNYHIFAFNTMLEGLGFRMVYALMEEYSFTSVREIIEAFRKISSKQLLELVKKHQINNQIYQEFDKEFKRELFKKKMSNNSKLAKKITTGEANE